MKNALVHIYPKRFPYLSHILCNSFAIVKSTGGKWFMVNKLEEPPQEV